MMIWPDYGDDADFRAITGAIVIGLVEQEAPEGLVVVKIRDWFGPKWVPYEAGSRGDEGLYGRRVPAPRFVPNRVLQQDLFSYPSLERIGSGPVLHRSQTSSSASSATPFELAKNHVFVWVSSGTTDSGRGALLGMVQRGDASWVWYVGLQAQPEWHATEVVGVTREEIARLQRIGEATLPPVG